MKGVVLDDAAVLLSEADDVATAITDLEAGRVIAADDPPGDRSELELEVAEPIPFGHKIALTGIEAGAPIRKYGEVIGSATERIESGERVHTHNCESDRGRGDLTAESEGST